MALTRVQPEALAPHAIRSRQPFPPRLPRSPNSIQVGGGEPSEGSADFPPPGPVPSASDWDPRRLRRGRVQSYSRERASVRSYQSMRGGAEPNSLTSYQCRRQGSRRPRRGGGAWSCTRDATPAHPLSFAQGRGPFSPSPLIGGGCSRGSKREPTCGSPPARLRCGPHRVPKGDPVRERGRRGGR